MDKALGELGSDQSRFHKEPVGLPARFDAASRSDLTRCNVTYSCLAYLCMQIVGRVMFVGTMATAAALTPGVVIAQSSKPTMKAIVVHEYGGPVIEVRRGATA